MACCVAIPNFSLGGDIFASISGYQIESDQAKKLVLARAYLEYLEGMITQTEVELYVRIKPYWAFVELIAALPGMSEISATTILAEIGVNMDVFEDENHLCSWCGLAPANNGSASKKKSVRIAKAGAYLKPLIVQCALAAVKSKKETYFAIKYGRIKNGVPIRKRLLQLQE